MRLEVTAVYQQVPEGGYVAWVEEIPGALTQGDTLDETRANLHDAVRLLVEARREMNANNTRQAGTVIREALLVTD